MTEREIRQQKEIERLQKKVKSLTEAYSQTARELQELKTEMGTSRKGCPGLEDRQRARILSLCQQGRSVYQIAEATGISDTIIDKVIAQAAARTRVVYMYMDREEPATLIDACNATRRIKIINFTDDLISRAFGIRTAPTWNDYEEFLETRCMPRTRYGIQEELRTLGLDFYDPALIIERTQGRVYEDSQWLWKMDADWIRDYDIIADQTRDEEELKCRLQKLLPSRERQEGKYYDTGGDTDQDGRKDRDDVLKR